MLLVHEGDGHVYRYLIYFPVPYSCGTFHTSPCLRRIVRLLYTLTILGVPDIITETQALPDIFMIKGTYKCVSPDARYALTLYTAAHKAFN
jgi:hypothetical protein